MMDESRLFAAIQNNKALQGKYKRSFLFDYTLIRLLLTEIQCPPSTDRYGQTRHTAKARHLVRQGDSDKAHVSRCQSLPWWSLFRRVCLTKHLIRFCTNTVIRSLLSITTIIRVTPLAGERTHRRACTRVLRPRDCVYLHLLVESDWARTFRQLPFHHLLLPSVRVRRIISSQLVLFAGQSLSLFLFFFFLFFLCSTSECDHVFSMDSSNSSQTNPSWSS